MRRLGGSIALEGVPWTLWLYVATTGVSLVVLLTRQIHVAPAIFAVIFAAIWDYSLLRGIRWVWIVTLVLFLCSLVVGLVIGSGTWWGTGIGLLQLVLLLLPPTRRFFGSPRGATATV
jgi:hypothetical protein